MFVLTDRISNSQTFEPIRSPKSPVVDLVGVDLVGNDLEVEEQEESRDRGRGRARGYKWGWGWWYKYKKKDYLKCLGAFYKEKKLMGNLKPNAIIVASFTWVTLAKVQPICVII